ncbi:MAG TPA: transcriptional regulator [Terriglobales bacterium]|jgi:DNA-binding HxlR family transcriptional regulator|nr:transcriptional regulator [Terriglobales bacterium]
MPRQEQEAHSERARVVRQEVRKRGEKSAQPVHDFDRLIHERMRLGILSALAVNESLTFNDLKSLLSTTDGNLSVHARKLEEAGYVACNKYFEGRVPRTEYRLTRVGRQALEQYLNDMESLIETMRKR